MPSVDTDKIIHDFNARFEAPLPEFYKRRIVFWYDEEREFEDKLDEIVLDNAKIAALLPEFCKLCIIFWYNEKQEFEECITKN